MVTSCARLGLQFEDLLRIICREVLHSTQQRILRPLRSYIFQDPLQWMEPRQSDHQTVWRRYTLDHHQLLLMFTFFPAVHPGTVLNHRLFCLVEQNVSYKEITTGLEPFGIPLC
ncbi:hypothetical protein JRQ81_005765 [Phrynocephalus forsythii]|uniref:Uncharacterized protein n=1 Tax=Phrynocephalus forsythii TaxID=171643 RepID=A0A9Q0Y5B1_9SAUR|nr:hypothetical protein JRQ81_005765 [Phrynocephalus forsythii]